MILCSIVLFGFIAAEFLRCVVASDSVVSIVKSQGYPIEVHKVISDDGYVLTVHRIPFGKISTKIGRPVLLQHGIMCSSICWVISRPDKALAFLLAEQGYDVWMTNSRGTSYSQKHLRLSPKEPPFWNFSFHEMGYYDLPAFIDYILLKTNHKKLHYVGHSMGTTMFFVMASTRPEYNEKVAHMSALAPIAYVDATRGTTKNLLLISGVLESYPDIPNLRAEELNYACSRQFEGWLARFRTDVISLLRSSFQKLARFTKTYEFLATSKFLHWMESTICSAGIFAELICENILFVVAGYDSPQFNNTLLPLLGKYLPDAFSIKLLIHYAQIAKSKSFAPFDHGIFKNYIIYGQRKPPAYSLDKVTTSVKLHYAANDWLAGEEDVMKLYSSISQTTQTRIVPFHFFNHLDFMWAVDVVELLYNDLISDMSQF